MSSTSDTTVGVVRDAARLWPDAEAVVDGETRLTFCELADAVVRSTRAALAAGLEQGDSVAVGNVVKDELRARSALTHD